MSSLHDSTVGDFTRGGQVLVHFLGMIGQVLRKFGGIVIVGHLLASATLWLHLTTAYGRYLGSRYFTAAVAVVAGNGVSVFEVERPRGARVRLRAVDFYRSPAMYGNARQLVYAWLRSMAYAGAGLGACLLGFLVWLFRFGAAQRREQFLRGGRVVEAAELSALLARSGRCSALRIAGVSLPSEAETTHILLTGSPGTGKTTSIHDLMVEIRARGDRCICYSPSGDFIEWFYRPDRDHLLNPFDARCPRWSIWSECREPFHYDMLAAALVPESGHGADPFWNTAARTLIACVAREMASSDEPSAEAFVRWLSIASLEELRSFLASTEASALLDPAAEKTAASIRTTAAAYTRALRYLPSQGDPIGIRSWVEADAGDGWIFLNAKADQLSSARPLLSAWLEVFTNALMSLPTSQSRRVWLIIDELPSLNRIPSLPDFLAQSRKYGGCGVIAFQQLAQLRERYGRDGAEAIAGLCATWVCLRQNDPDTARWVAQSFGETEVIESQQGLSYGANDMRDGVSLSTIRRTRPLVLPTQIANLDNLEGYLRMPGSLPVAHFRVTRGSLPVVSPPFVPAVPHGVASDAAGDFGAALPPDEVREYLDLSVN